MRSCGSFGDVAGAGVEDAAQDLHERRLAGTVGPDQAVAVCRRRTLTETFSNRGLAPNCWVMLAATSTSGGRLK